MIKYLSLVFALLCVLSGSVAAQTNNDEIRVDKKIVILLDESNSMTNPISPYKTKTGQDKLVSAYIWQLDSYIHALKSDEVKKAINQGKYKKIAITLIGFATNAGVRLDWVIVDSNNIHKLVNNFEKMKSLYFGGGGDVEHVGSATNVGVGLKLAKDIIMESSNIHAEQTIILVSGDGIQFDNNTIQAYPLSEEIAEFLKVTIIGIYFDSGITADMDFNERRLNELSVFYYTEVSKGVGSFVTFANSVDTIKDVWVRIFKLRRENIND